MRSILIAGEPALWSAGADQRSLAREKEWKERIKNSLRDAVLSPGSILLHFAVREWTRRGHHFDLDNLVTPVFRAMYGNSNRDRRDPIEAATKALIDAVTDFFPTRKRLLLRSLAEKQAAVTAKGTELALAKINDPALEDRLLKAAEARMTRELETLLGEWTGPASALSSPASAASAPKD